MSPGDDVPVRGAERQPAQGASEGDPGPLVLVVDDDDTTRETLMAVLAGAAIRTVGCARADEALQLQAVHAPALVVVDHRLPDSSGVQLARAMKERDEDLPVLMLTGYASIEAAIQSAGQLDAFLIKPVSAQTFLQASRNALARRVLLLENRSLADRLQRLDDYQALYDPLTGLPNRALLDDRIAQALASCRRSGTTLAVLFVDLDAFKIVNDSFGHHVGDELLKKMADRLAGTRRSSDTVARFGGDEFVVVCPDVKSSAVACRIAEHLVEELAIPAVAGGREHQLAASVGIALSSPGASGQSPETLLRNADTAMYRAKEAGGGAWELFDDAMHDRVVERFEIERGLRSSAETGHDLHLAYQPLVELATGAVVAAEALLRWDRDVSQTMTPAAFMAVAEESGLIVALGRWALDMALTDLAAALGADRVPATFRLWVNVSPHQLANPRFDEVVAELLEAHGVPPAMLGLEVVEEGLRDPRTTEKVLLAVREQGVSISIDDFGAGHSSLSWLQELPITGLKIDRRFVSELDRSDGGRTVAIVRGLLGLAHALGLSVVGEGVETSAQADALRNMGCELGQGYHFALPGTAEQLWSLVSQGREGTRFAREARGPSDLGSS